MKTTLHIGPTRLVSEVQQEFNKAFPFLKIEFFRNKSMASSGFNASQLIPHSSKLGDGRNKIVTGSIEIDEDMKVNELEQLFNKMFSLAVQVFRKSGNLWLETTMTDSWTLERQNNHGKEISTGKPNKDTAQDFDLMRDAD